MTSDQVHPPILATARPEDLAAIRALHTESWASAYAAHVPAEALGETLRAEMAVRWAQLPSGVICAWKDERLAGFVRLKDRDGWPYIDNLHVRPDLVRAGIGRALMGAAGEALAAAGEGRVWLTVLAGNRRARRFYEASGGVEGAPMSETLLGAPVATYPFIWARLDPLLAIGKNPSDAS